MRDDIKKLTTQRNDQVSALSRALEQCRVQLDQKQQLIATLQVPIYTIEESYPHTNETGNYAGSAF